LALIELESKVVLSGLWFVENDLQGGRKKRRAEIRRSFEGAGARENTWHLLLYFLFHPCEHILLDFFLAMTYVCS
jgi:hypothetical protein